jgi:alpha-glucoside transport system substrate-binding protein
MRKFSYLIGALLLLMPLVAFAGAEKESGDMEPLQTVSVYGAFVEQEETRFEVAMEAFTARTGVVVDYRGDKQFEAQIVVQVEAGDPPDSAPIPQPGLMQNFAQRGKIYVLPDSVVDAIDGNYTSAWKDLGSYNGDVYGVFHRVNAKSFVWYNKPAFEAAGYMTPTTWDELIALMDEIVSDGGVPWSIGIESGAATGWAATDWMEDIMLRTAGPEVYDDWVSHAIPFNDPAVKTAAEAMAGIWLTDKYVLGGTQSIATTNFGDAVQPLFTDPPQAWLHRQGNFITGFMQESVQADLENMVGVFALPEINPTWGTPVLGGGDQFVMFNDNPSVHDFLEYLTTWESASTWAAAGGALFPHQDQDFNDYGSTLEREMAKILVNAEVFRFDASDLMPGEVGAGSFWTGMADLVTGVPLDTVLDEIETSWP